MINNIEDLIEDISVMLKESEKYSGNLYERLNIYKNYLLNKEEKENFELRYMDYLTNLKFSESDDNKYVIITHNILNLKESNRELFGKLRGMVIDKETANIVIYPFDKFYNVRELGVSEDKLNEELMNYGGYLVNKLDGSIISMRYLKDSGETVVSSKGSLSRYNYKNNVILIADKYRDRLKNLLKENNNITFMFELIDKENKVVIDYDESLFGLYLIGARDMETKKLLSQEDLNSLAKKYNVLRESPNEINSYKEAFDFVNNNDFIGNEGVVIYTNKGNMYKLKRSDYLTKHKLIIFNFNNEFITEGSLSMFKSIHKDIVNAVLNAEDDDYYTYVNNTDKYSKIVKNIKDKIIEIDKDIDNLREKRLDRKELVFYINSNYDKEYGKLLKNDMFNPKEDFKLKAREGYINKNLIKESIEIFKTK